jgi:biopolymer transport protein ExbB/TolQ
MTQDKMRKMITAGVVAATTLLVFLFIVLIYQWITIGVSNKRIEKLSADNKELEQQIANGEELADYYEGQGRFWLALEQGWIQSEKGE